MCNFQPLAIKFMFLIADCCQIRFLPHWLVLWPLYVTVHGAVERKAIYGNKRFHSFVNILQNIAFFLN